MGPVVVEVTSTPPVRLLPQSRLCGVFGSQHGVAAPLRRPSEPGVHDDLLRVFWIDDEVHGSDVAVRALELERFNVECAQTGHDGVRIARHRAFDTILLDLRLPDTSGLDVLELLRGSGITAPIVILTGFADVETAVAAMKLGAADYRTKPLDVVEVVPLLRRLALRHRQERSPVSPQLTEIEWLQIRCARFGACVTRRQLIDVMLATLLDRRLTLPSFFGCAEALRILLTAFWVAHRSASGTTHRLLTAHRVKESNSL